MKPTAPIVNVYFLNMTKYQTGFSAESNTRRVLALGTAQRNIAAALVVGSQSFSDPKVVVMVVVVAIVGLLILMPLSRMLAKP